MATLLLWLLASERPPLLAAGQGFLFRGLIFIFPLLKGLSYWVRYPSLALRGESTILDFRQVFGEAADLWLAPAMSGLLLAVGVATVLGVLAANVGFFRRYARLAWRRHSGREPLRDWLAGYGVLAFGAALLVFAAAPTTPQSWQAVPLLHVTALPVVFGAGEAVRRWGEKRVLKGLAALALLSVVANLALATGGRHFRCSGRENLVFPLRASSPMFEQLGLQRSCPWPLDVPGAWWPDVLPEE